MPSRALPCSAALFVFTTTFGMVSCVSIDSAQQTAIVVQGVAKAPLVIAVVDHRDDLGAGDDRYYGRYRDGFGIPLPVADPQMAVGERLAHQLEAGFRSQGIDVDLVIPKSHADAVLPPGRKALVIRLQDAWIDFGAPITSNPSILHIDAVAQVISPDGKIRATAARKLEREFHYKKTDSFQNQSVLAMRPEFTQLVNEPAIRKALSER